MAQRIYLLLSAVLMIIVSCSDLACYIAKEDGLMYILDCTKLYIAEGGAVVSRAPWALMALAVLVTVVSFFNLFLVFFQNYALQKRLSLFNLLLVVGFMITYVGFLFYYKSLLEAIDCTPTLWAVAVPAIVAILQAMTFLAVRKKEADVLAKTSNFRLRD